MDETEIPPDFGARMRAARSYCGLSQEDMAERLGRSPGWWKPRERGEKKPTPLEYRGMVSALTDLSGLPEQFFRGSRDGGPSQLDRIEAALRELEGQVRLLRAERAAADAEALTRIDEVLRTIRRSQPPPQR